MVTVARAMETKVSCNEEGGGNRGKSNCNEGGGQATAMATTWGMMTATRLAGSNGGEGRR